MTSTLIYFIQGTHTLARMKITQKPNKLRKRVQKVAWLYKTMKLSIIVMENSNRLSTDCRPTIERYSDRLSTAISTDRLVDTTSSKQDPTDLSEINFLVLSISTIYQSRLLFSNRKQEANCRIISSIPKVSHVS